jgi:Large ribosomal RNA subunit accumulation protein YceD
MSDNTREAQSTLADESAPFSHVLEVDRVPGEGLDIAISAGPDERRALADFNEIPAIGRLEAEFHIAPRVGERINVSGELRAEVTQICVVSLEPFEAEIVEPIDVDFAPPAAIAPAMRGQAANNLEPSEMEEPPDPIIDGKIDLGALASEFLALGLDPYPRKPGVIFAPAGATQAAEDSPSPFAVLKKIQELG